MALAEWVNKVIVLQVSYLNRLIHKTRLTVDTDCKINVSVINLKQTLLLRSVGDYDIIVRKKNTDPRLGSLVRPLNFCAKNLFYFRGILF